MAREMSTAQRIAIRAIADDPGTAPLRIDARTLRSLIRQRLVAADAAGVTLTPAGCAAHQRIMASGDGPEDLKALMNRAIGSGWRL